MSTRTWSRVAVIVGVVSICIIYITWHREVTAYHPWPGQLADQAAVDHALQEQIPPAAGDEARVLVPTGVFIQSLAFLSATDVNLTGYIWQRYSADTRGRVSEGFVLPERIDAGSTTIEEAYRRDEPGGDLVIGWYFDVTLRQPFDYAKYPLDSHRVWLRMWHRDFDRNVVLTPDLASYESTRLGEAFGLDQEIVPGGWRIEETYFSYERASYDTNFGLEGYVGQRDFPELHFQIVVHRKFINAFIINLVPLLVVFALLFAMVMTVTGDKARAEAFGFNTSGAIGTAAALFFVVMLAHIQLRESFAGAGIVYLEYFYLVAYVAVLLSCLNVYLFSATGGGTGTHPWILHHRDNLIPKLVFWPAILLCLAVITLFFFH